MTTLEESPDAPLNEPGFDGTGAGLEGQTLVAIALLLIVGVAVLSFGLSWAAETIGFHNIRDLVFAVGLAYWVYTGYRFARYFSSILLLLTAGWGFYGIALVDDIGMILVLMVLILACLFSAFVLTCSRPAHLFLDRQLSATNARNQERRRPVGEPEAVFGYCQFCKREVQVDDEFRCPFCNWPAEPTGMNERIDRDSSR